MACLITEWWVLTELGEADYSPLGGRKVELRCQSGSRFGGRAKVSACKDISTAQVASIANSIVKVELLLFFHSNPMAMDSAKGLSMWLGRDQKAIEQAANELVEAMILRRYGEGEDAVYALADDPEVRRALMDFVSTTLSSKERRNAFLKQLMRGEAKKQ
ncbi:MAG: hypothetical protein RMK18_05035 [Armatimonadota bacterium]|nr:hypothetical protein [Armatimonadota bacterium]MCX7776641.1 hypothetical protein [Armatimonadota bacterium]MDW8025216.1 hypothetical protein [Armatimonadota bacterium]